MEKSQSSASVTATAVTPMDRRRRRSGRSNAKNRTRQFCGIYCSPHAQTKPATPPVTALTILTAADQAYWRCLWQFFRSAQRMGIERQARIVAYDLGMEPATVAGLRRRFPWVEFRRFDF